MALSSIVSILIVIVAVIIGDILCGDVTKIRQSGTNVWPQLGNSNPNTRVNASPGDTKSTTPWPALGQRRNQQRDDFFQSEQSNNRQPMWVRQSNSPNWVRNTPPNQGPNQNNPGSSNVRGNAQSNNNVRSSSSVGNPTNYNTNFLNIERGFTNTRPQSGLNQKQNSGVLSQNERGNVNINNGMTPIPVRSVGGGGGTPNQGPPSHNTNMGKVSPLLPPVEGGVSNNQPSGYNDGNSGTILTGSMFSETSNQNQNEGSSKDANVEDYELREFSEELLTKDINNVARYVTLNLQGKTTSRSTNDEAPLPLLSIDRSVYSIPSIEKLMLLYNNYILEASENEVYTAQEKIEENNLLDTILSTPVMQHTRNFLIKKGKVGKDPRDFKDLLRLIWFNMYSRGRGRIGSSGFEHVFLAELKNNEVSGLHNWLYFNEEESKNRANYLGYMKKVDLGNKGAVLKYHFTFQGVDKPVGSMFIGTSPELEIALYSTCFILRADRICPLKMGGNKFIIRTYTYRYRGKNMIGSAFPEI